MRAILMFHKCEGQSLSTDHNFWSERRAEADGFEPRSLCLQALQLGQTGSHTKLPEEQD